VDSLKSLPERQEAGLQQQRWNELLSPEKGSVRSCREDTALKLTCCDDDQCILRPGILGKLCNDGIRE